MYTTPWTRHKLSDKVLDTMPVCDICGLKLSPNARGIEGVVYVKDNRICFVVPTVFRECDRWRSPAQP